MAMWNAIRYDQLPEPVFQGKTRIVKYSPLGNYTTAVQAGEVVRFNLSDQNALLDPYDTYIEVTISFANNTALANDATYGFKIVQLDHSAHSIFNQLLLLHGNKELERIQEYDVLNAFLNDMNWGSELRSMRDYEGAGTVKANGLPSTVTTAAMVPVTNTGAAQAVKYWCPFEALGSYVDTNNRAYAFGFSAAGPAIPGAGAYNYPVNHPLVNNRLAFNPLGVNDAAVTYSSATVNAESYNDFSVPAPGNSNITGGSLQWFTPDFCNTGFEPFFSNTVIQRYMNNGFVKTDFINSATFFVKVRSAFIGELMPVERYKMLPLWLLPSLTLELTFAQHAFFTSWFTTNQAARGFQITQMYLHCTLIEPTYDIRKFVEDQYSSGGIRIPSQTFVMGPRQTISGGAVPASTQINQNFESMRNFFFMFMPNDYSSVACARKHYRLSMGISYVQLRIGNDYYPQLAIEGNGGTNHGPINNWEYLKYLYTCFGKHVHPSSCAINAQNFAVNCRALDPTLSSGSLFDNNQFSLFEENRVRGAAVYGIPLDKLNMNNSVLGGVNTYGQQPFQLDLQYSASRVFTRSVTMITFIHCDCVLKISKGAGGQPEVEMFK